MIKVKVIDGNEHQYESGVVPFIILKENHPDMIKKAVVAIVNNEVYELSRPIKNDCEIEFKLKGSKEAEKALNHTTAHVLAEAIKRLHPEASFGVGPAIDEGFYYDIDVNTKLSTDDLEVIEAEMRKIIKENSRMHREIVSPEKAREIFSQDLYKMELIEGIIERNEPIITYTQGEFTDLCAGGHLSTTGQIKAYKLLSIAGAYWRGDSNNKQLQRIYGISFFNSNDLNDYLDILEERKERDHRKIGKQMKLFEFTQETGSGLPIWLPNGFRIRKAISDYIYHEETMLGYEHVLTPDVGVKKLYEISGHWEHYAENMFPVMERNGEEFVLRPMTCPHHCMVYRSEIRSYRDLPVKIAEFGTQHRYEASGALIGLERVRTMNLSDAHLFIREDQIDEVIEETINFIYDTVRKFDLEIDYLELALRDPADKEKYHHNDELWNKAENKLREILDRNNIKYVEMQGEAAFYGPKIDAQVKTAIGHVITMSTIQLDFLLPDRFDLNYINSEGKKVRPVMVHRGLIGTFERFLAILIEQTKGVFPFWLAPTQAVVIPVSIPAHMQYAEKIYQTLRSRGIRVKFDDTNEKIGYKIRQAQINKIPYQIVLGDDEIKNQTITIRKYGEKESREITVEEFLKIK
jgi:threonyl-tRNA synthetase